MKRIIQFLSPIIFSLLFYMPVSANMLPSPGSGATELATQFASELASTWFADESGREVLGSTMQDVFRRSGFAPNATDSLSWEYKPCDWLNDDSIHLYNSEGVEVSKDDCLLAIGRNSFVGETFLYDKNTGEILNIGYDYPSSQTSLNGYKPGSASGPGVFLPSGSLSKNYNPFENFDSFWFTDDRADAIAVYRSEDMTTEKIEYLETLPSASWGVHQSGNYGFYCVQNVPGVCINVGQNNNNGIGSPLFYLNDGYQAYLHIWNNNNPSDSSTSLAVVTNSRSSYDGITYNYGYPNRGANPYYPGYYNGKNSYYNPSAPDLSGVIFTFPITLNNEPGDVINYDNYKNYTIDRTTTINNNYDNSSNVSTQNFPIYQTISYPSYSPTYNYYYYYDQAENNPGTNGGDVGTLPDDSVTLPDNIPILSNLEKRFPFSIPWDIKNLLSSLETTAQAPVIDLSFTIPVINFDWQLVVDLSSWASIAELFRTCFLISFIIGLAIFSYSHFFGS